MISYLNKSGLKLKERLYSEITDSSDIFEISYDSVNSGVNFEAFEKDIFKRIVLPNSLSQCDKVDFDSLREFIEYKTRKIYLLKQIVDEEFVFYNEYLSGEKVKLEGALKEVKAKISFLGGFEGNVINTFVENFNNLLQLDRRSKNTLKIDTDAEVCTLPVSRETKLDVKDIKILSSSNGIAGTILEEENSYLSNAFNSNQNLYFEYYKRGRKALKLNIEVTLNAESFVNYLEISIKNKYLESNFQIEEVLYTNSNGKTKSIFSCIGKEEQKLELASYNKDRKVSIAHLPVEASKVKIFLTCSEHSMINYAPYNVIALKEVAFYRKAYDQSGILTFKEDLLENSGAAILSAKVTSFPKNIDENIFKTKAVFEEEREEEIGADFLILDQDYESVRYSFEMHKPESLENVYNDEASVREISLNTKQYRFNKDVRPNTFSLPYGARNITVYQPNIYQRSFALNKAKFIGVTSSGVSTLLLPEPLRNLELNEGDIRVYANNVLCKKSSRIRDDSDDYSFSIKNEKIIIKDNSESFGREIKILISPSESNSWLEGDKVYFVVNDFTDKDKDQLLLRSFNKRTVRAEAFFENSNDSIKLNNEFVCNVSVTDKNNIDISSLYEVDTQKGLLDLKEEAVADFPINVEYEYFNYKTARPNKFLIENKKIIGFSINSNLVNINEYVHRVSENLNAYEYMRKVRDSKSERNLQILNTNSKRKIILKSKNILRKSFYLPIDFFNENSRPLEVDYINGRDEFIDIVFVTEPIPLMETSISGELKFTLRKAPSNEFFSYKIFKDGEEVDYSSYSLSIENRIVTLETSENSSRGLSISYTIDKNQQLDEKYVKYSVDYNRGVVYFNSDVDLSSSKKMRYSTCMASLESSVCKQLEDWSFEEGVLSLNPSDASDYNSLVKISWEDAIEEDYKTLKDYFSPLVYKVEYKIEG